MRGGRFPLLRGGEWVIPLAGNHFLFNCSILAPNFAVHTVLLKSALFDNTARWSRLLN